MDIGAAGRTDEGEERERERDLGNNRDSGDNKGGGGKQ